jgi:hypothetical protein
MQRTIDVDKLWPPLPNDCWGHCGNELGLFGSLKRFNGPLFARYLQPQVYIHVIVLADTVLRYRCPITRAKLPLQ